MQVRSPGPARMGRPNTLAGQIRLFPNHPGIRWKQRVHETILESVVSIGLQLRPTEVEILHTGYQDPAELRRKMIRNIALLQMELDEQPERASTLIYLGWTYLGLGQPDRALPYLQLALPRLGRSDGFGSKGYVLLASAYRDLERGDEAVRVCERGLATFPGDGDLRELQAGLRENSAGARVPVRGCPERAPSDMPSPTPAGAVHGGARQPTGGLAPTPPLARAASCAKSEYSQRLTSGAPRREEPDSGSGAALAPEVQAAEPVQAEGRRSSPLIPTWELSLPSPSRRLVTLLGAGACGAAAATLFGLQPSGQTLLLVTALITAVSSISALWSP
jgi:hypothetical protein